MKEKFIPVNNDLNKAIAFANSLDQNFIKNVQRIKQKPFYINSLDAVKMFQNEGWYLRGVDERRASNRKISSNYIQLTHTDLNITNNKGKVDSLASITISNSCSGNKPLQMDLGAYRLVCSNGLVRFDKASSETVKHHEINYNNLDQFVARLTNKANTLIDVINDMKHRELSTDEIKKLAFRAARSRYSEDELDRINIDDLFTAHRNEDEGNNLWNVLNRVQENLTHDITNKDYDIKLNKQIFQLAENLI